MTTNQVAYHNLLETQRSNRARETENERSNKARESLSNREVTVKETKMPHEIGNIKSQTLKNRMEAFVGIPSKAYSNISKGTRDALGGQLDILKILV